MAELYFPFASNNGDRMVGVETYERMLGTIFTQGVFPRGEMLSVAIAGGMNVQINTGSAILVRTGNRASLFHNTTPVVLPLGIADGVAERIDTIVLRRNNTERKISVVLLPGTPSANPVAAEYSRTEDYWDLVLARVHVRAGVTEISRADIVDCRADTELCGTVSSIAEIDSGNFYAQQTALFDEWFARLKVTLEDDTAGNLAVQVLDLESKTDGAMCEIWNGDVAIPVSAWEYSEAEMRYNAKIENSAFTPERDVYWQISDAQSGRFILHFLLPQEGFLPLYSYTLPTETINLIMSVRERRGEAAGGEYVPLQGSWEANAIVETASGEFVALSDSAERYFEGMRIFGKTTQDGTPTPDAPVELVSVGAEGNVNVVVIGAQLIPPKTLPTAYTFSSAGDGFWTANSVHGTSSPGTITLRGGVNYTYSVSIVSGGGDLPCLIIRDPSNTVTYGVNSSDVTKPVTFTPTQDTECMFLMQAQTSGTAVTIGTVFAPMLNVGATALPWEAYNSNTIALSTPDGLNSIGEVRDEIDLERGKLIRRIGNIASYAGESVGDVWMSSTGELSTGAHVIYALAAPVEAELSAEEVLAYRNLHSNYPSTTVRTDSGAELEVRYVADTKAYIDKKIAAIGG